DQAEWDASHADVVKLEQVPHPQTAIFTADHHSGYVVAMVGGSDYDRSVFNRAVQACRQPGSTYKPIYYSLGLDQGFGFDTVLDDVPVAITDPDTGETWTPTNLGDTLPEDPQLAMSDRLDRVAATVGYQTTEAIAPRTAFLMTRLLAHEVEFGFANVLRATGVNAAGKTGTSSATHDNMFIAFTSKFTTLVWMGDDKKERALGKNDAAYLTVVPLWSRYMYAAAKNYPNPAIPWIAPPGQK